jgi:hypothetical protein
MFHLNVHSRIILLVYNINPSQSITPGPSIYSTNEISVFASVESGVFVLIIRRIVLSNYIPGICNKNQYVASGHRIHREDLRIMPGIHPKIVRRILMRKSAPQPVLRKTARGGIRIAKK